MGVDIREQITQRILTVLRTVPGFLAVYRNRGQVPANDSDGNPMLPCCVYLDGKETPVADDMGFQGQSVRGQMPPVTVNMEPSIYIVLLPSLTPDNLGIGELLSSFRVGIHKAITRDPTLLSLLGYDGGITYLGFETDMQEGGDLRGVMRLDYRFAYLFDPSQL